MPQEPFVVPAWLASGHLQTVGAALPLWAPPRSFRQPFGEVLRIPLSPIGALLARAWWQPGERPLRTAILVHGVGGSSESRYVVRAAVAFFRAGWHVVRLNLRGAGSSIPEAPQLYHAGLTEDLRVAVEHLAGRDQVRAVALVGFSLGGHVVVRLAGELGPERALSSLRAAVAISAPLDLTEATRAIERPGRLAYHAYVLLALIRQADAFARTHPARAAYRRSSLWRLRSIRAYDGRVIAPMHGFASAEDYYARASAGPLVSRIALPTLLVHAEDDPMVPAHSLRPWLAGAPAALEAEFTERGGHVGWFGGMSESRWVDTWAIDRARSFLTAHL